MTTHVRSYIASIDRETKSTLENYLLLRCLYFVVSHQGTLTVGQHLLVDSPEADTL